MNNAQFEKISKIEAPLEAVFQWHARPGAIERYSPPWDPIAVVKKKGGIEAGAEVVLRMKAGPVPYLWHAKHTEYEENSYFRDKQVRGPFLNWTHTHEFEAIDQNSCYLRDLIEFRLPPHPFRGKLSNVFIQKALQRIFAYRHRVLEQDLKLQMAFADRKPMTILISGSTGLVASALIPLLTTGGHRVLRLVRKKPLSAQEVFWDPAKGQIDHAALPLVDAVINLAGEKIGNARWSQKKKESIIDSRVLGTRLLVQTMLQMKRPPEVFINASAIGFYGDRGEKMLTESDEAGSDFISAVCQDWENETFPAEKAGIRTVNLRIGVVLDPRGGALEQMMPWFRMKVATVLGSGNQFVSWLGLNDTADILFFILNDASLAGPINAVAPEACTGNILSQSLAQQLSSFLALKIPAPVLKLAFGQMGQELLLSSTRVKPTVLESSKYSFRNADLGGLLKHVLGKES